MENHPLPFICTTNLMNSLDQASLRRFTFKSEFRYLTKGQQQQAFKHFFGVNPPLMLQNLSNLTPGDFAVVKKKAGILNQLNHSELIVNYLADEVVARQPAAKIIGFNQ
jgi:SpoVK/Ycf46/Vps4 family AAA+-type ATPase